MTARSGCVTALLLMLLMSAALHIDQLETRDLPKLTGPFPIPIPVRAHKPYTDRSKTCSRTADMFLSRISLVPTTESTGQLTHRLHPLLGVLVEHERFARMDNVDNCGRTDRFEIFEEDSGVPSVR